MMTILMKKSGTFVETSPTFVVWIPSADGTGHWEEDIYIVTKAISRFSRRKA